MKQRVGFTCSTFDLFHAGHILMLEEARRQCDHLIVGIQTDPTIDRPEKNKPVQTMFERFVQVRACKYVDEIVVYSTEADLLNLLQSFPIDVRILGEEYEGKDFTGHLIPMEFYFNRRRHTFSSSGLRHRVCGAELEARGEVSIKMEVWQGMYGDRAFKEAEPS
jgi:glycerol-3-phosphate cytidylyltransferase